MWRLAGSEEDYRLKNIILILASLAKLICMEDDSNKSNNLPRLVVADFYQIFSLITFYEHIHLVEKLRELTNDEEERHEILDNLGTFLFTENDGFKANFLQEFRKRIPCKPKPLQTNVLTLNCWNTDGYITCHVYPLPSRNIVRTHLQVSNCRVFVRFQLERH